MVELATRAEVDRLTWEMDTQGIRPDYGWWLRRHRPEWNWDYRHFLAMQKLLNRMTQGELLRMICSIPIRHGKSEHNTISYPVYRLDRNRKFKIILISHNERQALKFSRRLLRLANEVGIPLARDAIHDWETTEGGGVIALGAGAGTASLSADLIVVDDPIGKREHAESQTRREGLWDWITNDVLSRVEPTTALLFTMSRWHVDDIAGRMLSGRAGSAWHVVDWPGEAEEDGDEFGRVKGEPLWPSHRGHGWIQEKKDELGAYGFASLVQGRPRPREGGMFKWDWWIEVDAVPQVPAYIRYWDTAGTDAVNSDDPDWTAGALLCRLPDQRTCIVDIVRFRHDVARRDAEMERVAREDIQKYGHKVQWWIETESGVGGRDRTTQLVRRLQATGLVVRADPRPSTNKVLRAEPVAAKAGAGNMLIGPGEWRNPFRSEAADFPGGSHDDQIDAVAGADAKLASRATVHVTTVRQ